MFKIISLILSVSLSFFIASCGSGDTTEQETGSTPTPEVVKAPTYITMPDSTAIAVTLIDSIDTDVQVSGTEFRAVLSRPIVVDGRTLFADGAGAKGVLNKVVESGRLQTPAELDFSLTALQDGSGRWISVSTDLIQDNKDSHTKRQVAMIGGGAIVGGVIGKIIDRKGSTEIGAAVGAAAGTGLAAATGKRDIFYGPGTEVIFFSSQPTRIAVK